MSFTPYMDAVLGQGQHTQPVHDLSPHVDGGPASAKGTSNASATASDKAVLHIACGIVLTALVLLWAMGALVFSSARL